MKHSLLLIGLLLSGLALAGTDYSTWMHMKNADWRTTSYTRENWIDPDNPEAAPVTVAASTKRQFYADKSIETPSGTSTFGGETLAVASTFSLNSYGSKHTIADLILLNGSTIKQTGYGMTHAGAARVEGTATYAFGLYSDGSTWTVSSSFASASDAVLNFVYGTARTKANAMKQTISLTGSWSAFEGRLNFRKGAYYLLGDNATPFAGTLCVESNAFVKISQTSGTFQVGTLRLENDGYLMFGVANKATVQLVVTNKLEIVDSPVIDVIIPTDTDHFDLIKLTGTAAQADNLPDVSKLSLAPEQIVGILPQYKFEIIDGATADEKIVRISWPSFKCMTKSNNYSTGYSASAFTSGNDSYWTPSGVPSADEVCAVRIDNTLLAHAYGKVNYPNLTLCLRDKSFFNNADKAIFDAVYFDGTCTMSGSGHAGGAGYNKILCADVYISGKLSIEGWSDPVRGISGSIHGMGTLVAGSTSGRGILLEGSDSDFAGNYYLYGQSASYDSRPTKFVSIGNGFGFGGAYSGTVPAWRSVVVSNAYVTCSSDVTANASNRGMYLVGGSNFEVPANKVLSISDALTVEGSLVKRGAGALVLGNASLAFANNGVQQATPVVGKNELTIAAGSLKVTNKNAVNGLKVTFAEGTKWVVDLASADAELKASGVINTLSETPSVSTAADGKFAIELKTDGMGDAALSFSICTVSNAVSAMQFTYPDNIDRRLVNLVAQSNPDGTISYVLKVEAKRGLMFLIDGQSSVSDAPAGAWGVERMRFGALADIHIAGSSDLTGFEKALRKYDAWQADAVLCSGDIADYGLYQQLKLAGDTWKKVFPNGRRSDGKAIVNLLHYGDHDMSTAYADIPAAKALCPDDTERAASVIFNGDRGAFWKAAFGENEPWAPIVLRYVKGYPFVLSHFTRGEAGNENGNNVPGLEAFLQEHAAAFTSGKPFFYSQHRIPRNTVLGAGIWGEDDGTTTEILSKYPTAIAFCGHYHMAAATERSIWQGAFTCIQSPGHRYSCSEAGYENGYAPADSDSPRMRTMRAAVNNSARQFLFCRVYDKALVIERLEYSGSTVYHLGDDWVVPF